ncbi:MAG: hypothetical protein K2X93_06000 [Candidatus Obscuribacterales bacterium]|nr:hypothetical protein [Candidatus Obscuribacterales bacterium]
MTQEVLGRFDDYPISNEVVELKTTATRSLDAPIDFSRMYNAATQMMLDASIDPWVEKLMANA